MTFVAHCTCLSIRFLFVSLPADAFRRKKVLLKNDYFKNVDLFDRILGKTSHLPSIFIYLLKKRSKTRKQNFPKLLQVEYLRQFFNPSWRHPNSINFLINLITLGDRHNILILSA